VLAGVFDIASDLFFVFVWFTAHWQFMWGQLLGRVQISGDSSTWHVDYKKLMLRNVCVFWQFMSGPKQAFTKLLIPVYMYTQMVEIVHYWPRNRRKVIPAFPFFYIHPYSHMYLLIWWTQEFYWIIVSRLIRKKGNC